VRAGHNELVILLDGDDVTPVLAEMMARPYRKEETSRRQDRTYPERPCAPRQKALVENRISKFWNREKIKRKHERKDMQETRLEWLDARRGFDIEREDPPVECPSQPHRGEQVTIQE